MDEPLADVERIDPRELAGNGYPHAEIPGPRFRPRALRARCVKPPIRNLPRLLLACWFLPISAVPACTTVRPFGANDSLAAGEGIVVIDIDSGLPITELSINQARALSDVPKGEYFRLVAVDAGNHYWSGIIVPAAEGPVPFRMRYAEPWKFRVEPGRINYPGQLIFGGAVHAKGVEISVQYRNRSGLALRLLRERFPDLLARYPPIFAGSGRDDYLDYFGRTFRSHDGAPEDGPP